MIKVKICGITNNEDAFHAVQYGADALGFVFYSKSPRYVEKEVVKNICTSIPPFITTVGVFVNEDSILINSIAEFCSLDVIQLHGDESPDFCSQVNKKAIKAFRVKDKTIIKNIQEYPLNTILLDTYDDNRYGGSGKTGDWDIACDVKETKKDTRIILSGGLSNENILMAIRKVQPYAVDVSSGVESSEGKKDPIKIKRFIELVKSSNW